jgi:UDP-N-acetylmuramoyl-tripeptide--D-alanyl-D-alanine ligase
MRIEAPWVAAVVGGSPYGDLESIVIDGVDFDSRTIAPGQMFVALVAERDGHHHLVDAADRGAALHLCSDPAAVAAAGVPAVIVEDTLLALGSLAAAVRDELLADTRVVGITGSVGKTSTKDLTSAALSAGLVTHANRASFNNEQGLPVTVLTAPDGCAALVVEMGMRGHGQIAELCRIARPDIGVVTAVGESHTELVGGLDGVARAKGELVEALPPSGTAVLNAADPRVIAMAPRCAGSVLTFGADGDVRAERIALDERARASFVARTPWGSAQVRLTLSGEHMVSNACAALAVAGAVGVDVEAAAAAMGAVPAAPGRMAVVEARNGLVVVDDTYNANPTSVEAALRALVAVPAAHHVAMLGLMAELEDPGPSHVAITELCRRLGVRLIPVECDLYGAEAVTVDALADLRFDDSTAVLVKGSRVAGLERVVRLLTNG